MNNETQNPSKTNQPATQPETKAFELPRYASIESLTETHGAQYARSLYRQICAAGGFGQLLDVYGEANAPALDLVDLLPEQKAAIEKILTK